MKELMILLAKEMPIEILVDKMEEAFNEYRREQSKESKNTLAFYAQMFSLRIGTEDRDSMDVIKEFSNNQQLMNAFGQKS